MNIPDDVIWGPDLNMAPNDNYTVASFSPFEFLISDPLVGLWIGGEFYCTLTALKEGEAVLKIMTADDEAIYRKLFVKFFPGNSVWKD